MNKKQIYEFIKDKNIWYEIVEHDAVYNMADIEKINLPYKEKDAKNLFLCDDKKNYYLITVDPIKKVNLKEFRKKYNIRPLSFALEEDLLNIMNLTKGSVTPLGILNDTDKKVIVYMPTWRGILIDKKNEEQNLQIINDLKQIDENLDENTIMYVKLHNYTESMIDYSMFNKIKTFPKEYP